MRFLPLFVALVLAGCERSASPDPPAPVDPKRAEVRLVPEPAADPRLVQPARPALPRCTPDMVDGIVVHGREPSRAFFAAALREATALVNAVAGLNGELRPLGWEVVGQDQEICALRYRYLDGGQLQQASFGVVLTPTPRIFAADREALSLVNLGDSVFDRRQGVHVEHQREMAKLTREDEALRTGGQLDAWVEPSSPTTMWMQPGSCRPVTLEGREHRSAVRAYRRAGFTEIHCTSQTGDIITPLPETGRHRH